jgi:hypothetical protein
VAGIVLRVSSAPEAPARRVDRSKLLGALAGAAARIAANAIGFGVAGSLLNALLIAVCWDEIEGLTSFSGGGGPAHGGGAGAVLMVVVLAAAYYKSIIAFLLLFPGFPLAWFMVGKKRGLDAALRLIARTYKTGLVEYLVERVAERLRAPEWAARYNQSGLRATLNELLPVYLAQLDDLPRPARPLLRAFVARADVGGFLLSTVENRQLASLDPDVIASEAAARANELIDERLLSSSWRPVLAVLAINLSFAGLVVLFGR